MVVRFRYRSLDSFLLSTVLNSHIIEFCIFVSCISIFSSSYYQALLNLNFITIYYSRTIHLMTDFFKSLNYFFSDQRAATGNPINYQRLLPLESVAHSYFSYSYLLSSATILFQIKGKGDFFLMWEGRIEPSKLKTGTICLALNHPGFKNPLKLFIFCMTRKHAVHLHVQSDELWKKQIIMCC